MRFTSPGFRERLRPLWEDFLAQAEPLRPELFRLALDLTRNPFDAEDLVAHGLLEAFSLRALDDNALDDPRACVTRVVTDLWAERQRGRPETAAGSPDALRARAPRASRACVDRFVAAFLTYRLDAIRAVVADDLVADNFPIGFGTGIDHHVEKGWVNGAFYHHVAAHETAHEPYPLRLDVREVCGEHAILVFRGAPGRAAAGDALEEVWLLDERDGRVARITDYCFRPDLVQWLGEHLTVPYRRGPYRPSARSPQAASGAAS